MNMLSLKITLVHILIDGISWRKYYFLLLGVLLKEKNLLLERSKFFPVGVALYKEIWVSGWESLTANSAVFDDN